VVLCVIDVSLRTGRVMRNIPGVARAYRWYFATVIDFLFLHFGVERGTRIRKIMETVTQPSPQPTLSHVKNAISYMKRTTPEKYHDILLPKYRLGQKRRVFDTEYLECLHRENVLLTNDLVTRVTPNSVITTSGKEYEADVIILANGFHMKSFIFPMKVVNKTRGLTLDDAPETGVWRESGPQAYLGKLPNSRTPFNLAWQFLPVLADFGRMLCLRIPEFFHAHWSEYRDGTSQCHVHIGMCK
jgi:cation diffusion facilitator CzcD-associated flavoprotein CzcO